MKHYKDVSKVLLTGVAQLAEHWSPKPGVGSSSLSTRANSMSMKSNFFKKALNGLKESYNELVHKVTWPTRAELSNSAVIVLIASIIIALVVWAMDFSFEKIMTFIYGLF